MSERSMATAPRRKGHGGPKQRSSDPAYTGSDRTLSHEEKARLGLLALPTFALALAITMVSTYLGEVTRRYTHETVLIGAIVGGEGVMALWIPLFAGAWSDQVRTRIGGRLPFVIAGTVPAALALSLIGVLTSLGTVALVAALFFAFYFVVYEPYRAMYPDLVEDEAVAGRAQSSQALARGAGTGMALLGGGLLLSVARPLPFVVAALILVSALAAFVVLVLRRGSVQRGARARGKQHADSVRDLAKRLARMICGHRALAAYLIANALWEMSLSSLKAFVILYLTVGLHYKLSTSSLIIGGVALVILVGAGAAGKLGDRFGRLRVVQVALWAYGLGYLVPIVTTDRVAIAAAMPLIALGGGAVMTLAYALLMPLMPESEHGALTGFYSLSRGLGIVSGPVLAGVLIWATQGNLFAGTDGFQAMWIVCAAGALLSLLFVRVLARSSGDRRELRRR